MRCPDEYGAPCGHRSCRRCAPDDAEPEPCPKCRGEGEHHDPEERHNGKPCHCCNGTGRVYVEAEP